MMKNVKKGFAASREAETDARASRRRNTPILRADEATPVLFNGSPDEPLMVKVHSVTFRRKDGSQGFEKLYCSMDETGQCEGCNRHAAGDKRVGQANDHGAFSVIDLRWYGRVKADKPGQDGKDRYWTNALPESVADPFGEKPDKVKFRGKTYREEDIVRSEGSQLLLLANRWTLALGATHEAATRKCASCAKGKISIEGYKVGKKTFPEPPDDEDYRTIYSCSKCDDPSPGGIFTRVPTYIRKSGEGTSTVYSFDQDLSADMESMDWLDDIKPMDLEMACAHTGSARYDLLLGGGNGAGADRKAQGKKREVEDDGEGEEDDEEDSLYNKSKSSSSSEGGKARFKFKRG